MPHSALWLLTPITHCYCLKLCMFPHSNFSADSNGWKCPHVHTRPVHRHCLPKGLAALWCRPCAQGCGLGDSTVGMNSEEIPKAAPSESLPKLSCPQLTDDTIWPLRLPWPIECMCPTPTATEIQIYNGLNRLEDYFMITYQRGDKQCRAELMWWVYGVGEMNFSFLWTQGSEFAHITWLISH